MASAAKRVALAVRTSGTEDAILLVSAEDRSVHLGIWLALPETTIDPADARERLSGQVPRQPGGQSLGGDPDPEKVGDRGRALGGEVRQALRSDEGVGMEAIREGGHGLGIKEVL